MGSLRGGAARGVWGFSLVPVPVRLGRDPNLWLRLACCGMRVLRHAVVGLLLFPLVACSASCVACCVRFSLSASIVPRGTEGNSRILCSCGIPLPMGRVPHSTWSASHDTRHVQEGNGTQLAPLSAPALSGCCSLATFVGSVHDSPRDPLTNDKRRALLALWRDSRAEANQGERT